MKYLALGFGLLTLLVFNLPAATQQKTSDDAAVRATVTDYIEGYYNGTDKRAGCFGRHCFSQTRHSTLG